MLVDSQREIELACFALRGSVAPKAFEREERQLCEP
jgi:hypothetical protein